MREAKEAGYLRLRSDTAPPEGFIEREGAESFYDRVFPDAIENEEDEEEGEGDGDAAELSEEDNVLTDAAIGQADLLTDNEFVSALRRPPRDVDDRARFARTALERLFQWARHRGHPAGNPPVRLPACVVRQYRRRDVQEAYHMLRCALVFV
jgi:hypothetical protein